MNRFISFLSMENLSVKKKQLIKNASPLLHLSHYVHHTLSPYSHSLSLSRMIFGHFTIAGASISPPKTAIVLVVCYLTF